MQSVKFRIEGDNTSGMRALRQVQQGFKDLANDANRYLGNKMVQYLGVAAIEATIQKTGEWAEQLSKSAQELNINTEEMQALQIAAKRANVDVSAVTGVYTRMASAAKEALNGNVLLRNSLKNLGIEGKNLASMTGAQMFGAMTKAVKGKPQNFAGDLQRIFGEENLQSVGAVLQEMGGKTPQQYAKQQGGLVAPSESIATLTLIWGALLEDLKEL